MLEKALLYLTMQGGKAIMYSRADGRKVKKKRFLYEACDYIWHI